MQGTWSDVCHALGRLEPLWNSPGTSGSGDTSSAPLVHRGTPCLPCLWRSWGISGVLTLLLGSCTGLLLLLRPQPRLGMALEQRLLHHLPWSGSSTALTKAKPTPQGQPFPKKANRLFPFTGCSQNLISQHDQSLHWDDLLSYSNKMNILTNNTHKIHWTAQWKELQCMKN